jgi:hypothetical protein
MGLFSHDKKIARCRRWLAPGLAILILTTLATGLSAQPPIAPEEVAKAWLKLVDGGQSANSWAQAGAVFKARNSEQTWQAMLTAIRSRLGPVESRKIASVQFSHSLLGAPDGEYALVRFNSAFVHKSSVLETLSLGNEHNHWVVIGYFIR